MFNCGDSCQMPLKSKQQDMNLQGKQMYNAHGIVTHLPSSQTVAPSMLCRQPTAWCLLPRGRGAPATGSGTGGSVGSGGGGDAATDVRRGRAALPAGEAYPSAETRRATNACVVPTGNMRLKSTAKCTVKAL